MSSSAIPLWTLSVVTDMGEKLIGGGELLETLGKDHIQSIINTPMGFNKSLSQLSVQGYEEIAFSIPPRKGLEDLGLKQPL